HPDDHFVLTLDGVVCGEVIAVEGGDISAPVIREPDGSGFVHKHLGPAVQNPVGLVMDTQLQPVVYKWVNAFWQGQISPKGGSLILVDSDLRKIGELIFEQAVITATGFPTVNRRSKDLGTIAVTLQPARTTFVPGSGQPIHGLVPKDSKYLWP